MKKIITFLLVILYGCYCCCFAMDYQYVADNSPVKKSRHTIPLAEIEKVCFETEAYIIGMRIPEGMEPNCRLVVPYFEIKMPSLDAFEDNKRILGWNTKGNIVFISTANQNDKLPNGIAIGSTKEEVKSLLGDPFIESDNRLRYDNYDYEHQGIVFYIEDGKVSRITLFTAI